jgi:K+-transporting ATPase ATPase C chain
LKGKMKRDLIKSLKLTVAFCFLLSIGYVGVLWVFALISGPGKGSVEILSSNGREVGAAQIGQSFTRTDMFWGRPSAVNYAADASGGSNYGPSNPDYLKKVEARIDTFLKAHPYLTRKEVPSELVTASGSGLDPHIPVNAAYVQINRVASARKVPAERIRKIVDSLQENPVTGPAVVNVLKLNVALEEITE